MRKTLGKRAIVIASRKYVYSLSAADHARQVRNISVYTMRIASAVRPDSPSCSQPPVTCAGALTRVVISRARSAALASAVQILKTRSAGSKAAMRELVAALVRVARRFGADRARRDAQTSSLANAALEGGGVRVRGRLRAKLATTNH